MKKTIRNILIILAVFCAGVIFFSWQMNRREPVTDESSERPSLPVIYMVVNGTSVNEMFGVKQLLMEQELRESLTPLPADRSLHIIVEEYDNTIDGISYSVTEPTTGELVENGQIAGFTEKNGEITADFSVQGNIRSSQEYTLRLSLDTGGQSLNYYTRLVQGAGTDFSDYFSFAQSFVTGCLDKLQTDTMNSYLEPEDGAVNSSFTDVDIHSDADTVTWGSLAPAMVKEGVPVIKEFNRITASLEMNYIISAETSDGLTEYYRVRDFFRLGHLADGTTVSMLNFTRHAELIFDSGLNVQTDTGLDLGVRDISFEMKSSPDEGIAVFALGGDLWSYNNDTGELVRVFSFRGEAGAADADERSEMTEHDFLVDQVSDDGDIIFTLYGYMPSGSHEGQMGVSVFSYSASSRTAEERMFIPLAQSYAVLDMNISKLAYVNNNSELYLFLGTQLCMINMDDGSYTIVQDAIAGDCFWASESHRTVAWLDGGNSGKSTSATVMDLSSGGRMEIRARDGEGIVACGFMNEDFVYGFVKSEDIMSDSLGHDLAGMYRLLVQGSDDQVKKEYSPEGSERITGVVQEKNDLKLTLSEKSDDSYREAGSERIVSNENKSDQVTLEAQTYERTGQKIMLVFPNPAATADIRAYNAVISVPHGSSETVIEWPASARDGFYVYSEGGLKGFYDYADSAIIDADAEAGTVLNSAQQYVWIRGVWDSSYTIDSADIPSGVTDAGFDEDALAGILGENYTVLNLYGVSQEDLKYFINRGFPVLAKGNDRTYCIVGYDEYNIWVYDGQGNPKAIASDDSEAEFRENGNRFLTFIDA